MVLDKESLDFNILAIIELIQMYFAFELSGEKILIQDIIVPSLVISLEYLTSSIKFIFKEEFCHRSSIKWIEHNENQFQSLTTRCFSL